MGKTNEARTVGRPTTLNSEIPEFFKHFTERGLDGRQLDLMLAAALGYSDRTIRRVRTEGMDHKNLKTKVLATLSIEGENGMPLFLKSLARWRGDYLVTLVTNIARKNGWEG